MVATENSALAPIWAALREEVQQPELWKKSKQGWNTTRLLLEQPPECQAEFVLEAIRRSPKPEHKPVTPLGALGGFLSRLVSGQNTQLQTLVVNSRSVPLEQMSQKQRENYVESRLNYAASEVVNELVRHHVPLSSSQVIKLLELYAPAPRWPPQPLLNYLLRLAAKLHSSSEKDSRLGQALEKLRAGLEALRPHTEQREQLQRISQILDATPALELAKGPWIKMVLAEIEAWPDCENWRALLGHAASGGNPSGRWKQESAKLIEPLGQERVRQTAIRWLEAGVTPGEARRQLKPGEAELLKGFVWTLSSFEDLQTANALAGLAEECFRKIPMVGAVSHRVGNACVNTLAEMPGLNAVGQLSRLRARMKYATAKRLVEKALSQAAQRAGITRNDLEDIAVPDFDFEVPGVLRRQGGACTAELAIVGSTKVEWNWDSGKGKTSKTVPAEVKRNHAGFLKTLKRTAKDAEQMLRAQRLRMEKLFLTGHSVRYEDWRKRAIEHPLLAQMTRRLIWQFERGSLTKTQGIWNANEIVGADGKSLSGLEGSVVRLWHPLGTDVKTVLAWRNWLTLHEITQPFKQAHREIYALTDAERQTETYSNRFAAHILSQHTLSALCRERGWENRLQGQFDSGGATPTLHLPEQGFVVEFWVSAPPDAPLSASGISLYVATDQVRFCDTHRVPIALEHVPPRVFSEVMRDVDLFVGVTSIANDPEWIDQGDHPAFLPYWHTAALGDLSATALMRREILQELLPKLKIRDCCTIEEKFLAVRGDRATYKIHLGSGNVLMEPGSKYLCIVPGRNSATSAERTPGRIFLPFEGDHMLAIILSKAFLLAEDRQITDPTILRQLPN